MLRRPGTGDQAQRLREQKQDKTDAEAPFPAVVMGPGHWMEVKDAALQNAIFRGWMDWLAEGYSSHDRARFIPMGAMPGTAVDFFQID
jgi:hypothetical protein